MLCAFSTASTGNVDFVTAEEEVVMEEGLAPGDSEAVGDGLGEAVKLSVLEVLGEAPTVGDVVGVGVGEGLTLVGDGVAGVEVKEGVGVPLGE